MAAGRVPGCRPPDTPAAHGRRPGAADRRPPPRRPGPAHARVGQRPCRRRRRDRHRRARLPPLCRPRARATGARAVDHVVAQRPAQRHLRRAADRRAGVPDVARAAAGQGPQGRRRRSAGTATRPAGGHPLHVRWCDCDGPRSPGHRLARGGHCRSPRRRRRHPVVGRRDRRALPAEPGAVPDVARRPLARPRGAGRGRAHRRGPSAAQQGLPARTGPPLPVARLARAGPGPRPVRPHGRAGDRPRQDHAGTSGPHRLPARRRSC